MQGFRHFVLPVAIGILVAPVLWVVVSSFCATIFAGVPQPLTSGLTVRHYETVLRAGFANAMLVSVVTSAVATFASVVVALAVVACALHMSRKGMPLLVNVATWRLMPAAAFVLPQVYYLKQFPDIPPIVSLVALVALQQVPLNVLLVAPFALRIHDRYYEAAAIDGASNSYYTFRILLPQLVGPVSFAASISFMLCWLELFTPSLLITSREDWTLPMFMSQYITSYSTLWGEFYASAALTSGFALLLALLFSAVLRRSVATTLS